MILGLEDNLTRELAMSPKEKQYRELELTEVNLDKIRVMKLELAGR